MHALILANGDHPPPDLIRTLRAEVDLFIATDGAANALLALGELPDFVLGDFDSLHPTTVDQLPPELLLPAIDQEASDLDKALAFARRRGADRATVLGSFGSRIDHSLTAASLLLKYHGEMDVVLRSHNSALRLVRGSAVIEGSCGDMVSLVVFGAAKGVRLEGVEWPLEDETLLPGSRGVSNRLVDSRAHLSIRDGWALVCHLFGEHNNSSRI